MSEMALRFRVEASMAEAKASLDQGAAAFQKFGASAKSAMAGAAQGHAVMVNQAGLTGNVAAQFNDIGVMLAAGQNPFQLAIQQGTQLGQALQMAGGGVKGATAALKAGFMAMLSPTTLLTIAVIAGGAALVQWVMSAGDAATKSEELAGLVDDLTTSLHALKSAETAAAEPMDKLVEKYGALANAVRDARMQLADNAFAKAKDDFNALLSATNVGMTLPLADTAGLKDMITQFGALQAKIKQAQIDAAAQGTFYDSTKDSEQLNLLSNRIQNTAVYIGALRDEFRITQPQAEALAVAISAMNDAGTAKEQVIAAQALKDMLVQVFGSVKAADDATGGMVTALANAVDKGAELASVSGQVGGKLRTSVDVAIDLYDALKDAWNAAIGLTNAAPGAGWLAQPIAEARTLGALLWDAMVAADAARTTNPTVTRLPGGVDAIARGEISVSGTNANGGGNVTRRVPIVATGTGSSGGGSGGSTSGGLADLSAEAQKALADLDLAVAAINEKVKAGLMSTAEAGDAVNSARQKAGNDIATLIAQIDKLGPAGQAAAAALRVSLQDVTADLKKPIDDLSKSLSEGLSGPLKDFMKNAKTADEVFKAFGDSIIDKLIDIALQQAQMNLFQPLISGFMGSLGSSSGIGASIGEAFGLGGAGARVNPMAGVEAAMGKASANFARSASMETGKSAGGSPGGMVPQVNVKIEGVPAGHTATVDQKTTGMDQMLTVVIERVESAIGGNIRAGRGSVGTAIADTYGMARRPR
jgi:hypothetical protein